MLAGLKTVGLTHAMLPIANEFGLAAQCAGGDSAVEEGESRPK